MAICKECGAEYDPDEVRDSAWSTIGIFGKKSMSGLCFDCISEHYADTHDGEYPTDKFEDTTEDEEDEWRTEAVLERMEEEPDWLESLGSVIGALLRR